MPAILSPELVCISVYVMKESKKIVEKEERGKKGKGGISDF
jgi:hypothetical protein